MTDDTPLALTKWGRVVVYSVGIGSALGMVIALVNY